MQFMFLLSLLKKAKHNSSNHTRIYQASKPHRKFFYVTMTFLLPGMLFSLTLTGKFLPAFKLHLLNAETS